jgi:hypothetical protein
LTTIQLKRGTRARIDALASKGGLLEGEPLFITDENIYAIAKNSSTYLEILSKNSMTRDQLDSAKALSALVPGQLIFVSDFNILAIPITSSSYVQFESDNLPEDHVGNKVITSTADIVMSPNGNVQFDNKRILNVADPIGPRDVVNLQYLENTFPSYSTGTFTPVVEGTTTAGTATYTTQYGTWTKIGNIVFLRVAVNYTAHTGTGSISVPFSLFSPRAPLSSSAGNLIMSGDWNGGFGDSVLFCYIVNNKLFPARNYSGGAGASNITLPAECSLDFNLTFEV